MGKNFLEIPQIADPQLFMAMNKMAIYIRSLESALIKSGIVQIGEVTKEASRNEALFAIDHYEKYLDEARKQIERIPLPDQRMQAWQEWEGSDMKRYIEDAIRQYKQQLAESFE